MPAGDEFDVPTCTCGGDAVVSVLETVLPDAFGNPNDFTPLYILVCYDCAMKES